MRSVTAAREKLDDPSWANRAYEYWVLAASPESLNVVTFRVVSVTAVPPTGDVGACGPTARRIVTPVKSLSVGLTQARVAESEVTRKPTRVTGAGAVLSTALTTRGPAVAPSRLLLASTTIWNRQVPALFGA